MSTPATKPAAPESGTQIRSAPRRKRTPNDPGGLLASVFSCAPVELDDIRRAFDALIECLESACSPHAGAADREEARARAERAAMLALACFARLREDFDEGTRATKQLRGVASR
jgi:hypothetical protein